MINQQKKISIVIPAFNEEKNVAIIASEIQNIFASLSYAYQIIFVDDGSSDNTAQNLQALSTENSCIKFIILSKNFGHQLALKAGIDAADGDAVISLDADLQHPPTLIPTLLQYWEQGYDIVYTKRTEQQNISFAKKLTSNLFYSILNNLSNTKIEHGTADFRLFDKKVNDVVKNINELDVFWRGLFKWVGFKQIAVPYEAVERKHGKSKYTIKKMFQLALKGITSFSTKPLEMAIYIGFLFSVLSLLYVPYVLYSLYNGHYISGWASLIVTVAFFGGLQLMILGIIGIYLGKMFMQTKGRPAYIIKTSNV